MQQHTSSYHSRRVLLWLAAPAIGVSTKIWLPVAPGDWSLVIWTTAAIWLLAGAGSYLIYYLKLYELRKSSLPAYERKRIERELAERHFLGRARGDAEPPAKARRKKPSTGVKPSGNER